QCICSPSAKLPTRESDFQAGSAEACKEEIPLQVRCPRCEILGKKLRCFLLLIFGKDAVSSKNEPHNSHSNDVADKICQRAISRRRIAFALCINVLLLRSS